MDLQYLYNFRLGKHKRLHIRITTLHFLSIVVIEDRPHCICSPVSLNSNISMQQLNRVADDVLNFILLATIMLWSKITVQVKSHGGRARLKLLHGTNTSDGCNFKMERLGTLHL